MWPENLGGLALGVVVVIGWACVIVLVEVHARTKKRSKREDVER